MASETSVLVDCVRRGDRIIRLIYGLSRRSVLGMVEHPEGAWYVPAVDPLHRFGWSAAYADAAVLGLVLAA